MKKKICDITMSAFNLMLSILPIFFWIFLIYSFDEVMGASITIIAMIIHEFGHLVCIFMISGKIQIPQGRFNGLRILGQTFIPYSSQIWEYASGAAFNLIAALVMSLLSRNKNDYIELFITINLATAISNLLPIDGYDGYKLLTAIIEYFDLGFLAHVILEIISFVITVLLCIFSLFLVYTFGNGYWFMSIFLIATVNKLQKWQNYRNSRI